MEPLHSVRHPSFGRYQEYIKRACYLDETANRDTLHETPSPPVLCPPRSAGACRRCMFRTLREPRSRSQSRLLSPAAVDLMSMSSSGSSPSGRLSCHTAAAFSGKATEGCNCRWPLGDWGHTAPRCVKGACKRVRPTLQAYLLFVFALNHRQRRRSAEGRRCLRISETRCGSKRLTAEGKEDYCSV